MRTIPACLILMATPLCAQNGDAWHAGQVAALGIDSVALDRAFARAAVLEPITSLLVARDGVLAGEQYFLGWTPSRRANIKSASKSVISALMGIAIDRGLVTSVDAPVADFFPQFMGGDGDARRDRITLEHLLSMRSGLETTSFRNYGTWVTSPNWVAWALRRPMECAPGTCWSYSTGSTHLLSAILTQAAGRSTLAFAREALFGPIGVDLPPWDRDPQGIYLGGNNMMLTPRDLLAFGNLYLHGGRHAGRRVVPEAWIEASWKRLGRSPWNGHYYGYGWWTRDLRGHAAHFAWGYGGQYVFVVPSLRLVVVVTSALDRRRPRNHNWQIIRMVEEYVIPAVERDEGGRRGS